MESFVILWRAPYCLGNITGCLGNSHRIPMDDSVMCNLIPYEKLHLVSRDRHLRLYCPHHLPISLRLFSYLYIYYDILTILSFHTTLPMSFNFGCLSLYSLLQPISPVPFLKMLLFFQCVFQDSLSKTRCV